MVEALRGFAPYRHRVRCVDQARQEWQHEIGRRMERRQLDHQHLDLLVACLPEHFLDMPEAIGLGCEAKPEDRSPSKVEPQSRAAVAAAVDRIGSSGVVVNQDGDVAAGSWLDVVQQIGERWSLRYQLTSRVHERALARVANHEVLRVCGGVEPVDDPEIADALAPGVGQCPPPALRQRISGARRSVDTKTCAGLGDVGRGPDPL